MVEIVDIPTLGGYFKPDEHVNDVAILIEVTNLERQKPTNYGPKDTVHANLTAFRTEADLANGTPVEEQGTQIQQTALVSTLVPLVGKATIVKLAKAPSSKPGQNPAWVWRKVDAPTQQKVLEYVKAREAELEAAKSAMPSFLS